MTLANFIAEKLPLMILNLFCAIALSLYLTLLGNGPSVLPPVLCVWAVVLLAVWAMKYARLKEKTGEIFHSLDRLDQKYLVCEMLSKPETCGERVFQQVLKAACKSMLENINVLKSARREYEEYIEEWIHEVKTPITAIDLICKNHPQGESSRIATELSRIDYLVDQALYYARSESVEKDYFVREFSLFEALGPALMQNRTLLLEENITLTVEETQDLVCTDEKWLTYILNQLLSNAAKYHRAENAFIRIYARRWENGVFLTVEDNGKGIPPEDLPRIFDRGFTGGDRRNKKATGMGLYLCRKLCDRLGLTIFAKSSPGEGTKITIGFPMGTYVRPESENSLTTL